MIKQLKRVAAATAVLGLSTQFAMAGEPSVTTFVPPNHETNTGCSPGLVKRLKGVLAAH